MLSRLKPPCDRQHGEKHSETQHCWLVDLLEGAENLRAISKAPAAYILPPLLLISCFSKLLPPPDILFLKHASSILRQSSNLVVSP